jgi:hypothetical protein
MLAPSNASLGNVDADVCKRYAILLLAQICTEELISDISQSAIQYQVEASVA